MEEPVGIIDRVRLDSDDSSSTSCLRRELQEAQERAARAEASLKSLSEGFRMLGREIKQGNYNGVLLDADDDARTEATADCESVCSSRGGGVEQQPASCSCSFDNLRNSKSMNSSCTGTNTSSYANDQEADCILSELLGHDYEAGTTVAADWMSLHNAVAMLREHVRLALEESSLSQEAQVTAQQWKGKAEKANIENSKLLLVNKEMKSQVTRLYAERKVLIKEVKSLRKKLAEETTTRDKSELDKYIAEALVIHERQLAVATTSRNCQCQCQASNKQQPSSGISSLKDESIVEVTEPDEDNSDLALIPKKTESEQQQQNDSNAEPENMDTTSAPQTSSASRRAGGLGFGANVALGFGGKFKREAFPSSTSSSSSIPAPKSSEKVDDAMPADKLEVKQHESRARTFSSGGVSQKSDGKQPEEKPAVEQHETRARTFSRGSVSLGFDMFTSRVEKLLSGQNGMSLGSGGSSSCARTAPSLEKQQPNTSSASDELDDAVVLVESIDDGNDIVSVPEHIAFQQNQAQLAESQLASPALTPHESPKSPTGVVVEVDCHNNEKVLQSLAIPASGAHVANDTVLDAGGCDD